MTEFTRKQQEMIKNSDIARKLIEEDNYRNLLPVAARIVNLLCPRENLVTKDNLYFLTMGETKSSVRITWIEANEKYVISAPITLFGWDEEDLPSRVEEYKKNMKYLKHKNEIEAVRKEWQEAIARKKEIEAEKEEIDNLIASLKDTLVKLESEDE